MGNSIKYGLRENLLTADPDDCMAQVVDARTYTQDDIAQEIIKRGSTLSAADIAAYQKLEVEVCKAIIADGRKKLDEGTEKLNFWKAVRILLVLACIGCAIAAFAKLAN